MNIGMWRKALQVIPRISKEEWERLDFISRWLISTRAAVLIMTFISAAIAGILAIQHGRFNLVSWLVLTFGLIMAHATNNLVNDLVDFLKGVDRDNYFRAQYGPQPLEHGLLNLNQEIRYALITGLIALTAGVILVIMRGPLVLLLLLIGMVFVLFYTFPLKYYGLGEITVLIVWGPLMIGGGYYVVTGIWDWNVVLASLPYAFGVTTVLFGKHIDKYREDKQKHIFTMPVVIGERLTRFVVLGMMLLQYLLVIYLIAIGFFTPVMLIVLISLVTFFQILPLYRQPKPAEKPADYPEDAWPLWYVAFSFLHNRRFGLLYLLGLILETILKLFLLPR